MKNFIPYALVSSVVLASGVLAADVKIPPLANGAKLSDSAKREANVAMSRAIDFILSKQNPDGSWSSPDYPAMTAMPLWALIQSGSASKEVQDKAVSFLLKCVKPDGAIYVEPTTKRKGGGLKNYNTALSMVALHATGRADVIPVVQKARVVVAAGQHFGGDEYDGGMGYDAENMQAYADLSNSYMAFEAMRLTQSVEDLRKDGEKKADLDWKAAQDFIARVQNTKAGTSDDHKGGFAYTPTESKAGTYTNADGTVHFRSYGSMTYAGLLSFIYADVSKDDPRVKSAYDWSTRHWTLAENPGMQQQGYYYFLNVLAKGLKTYGQDIVVLPDGKRVNWREEIINKLVNLQKIDGSKGYWINEANRWQEGDPVLVTSYALIALAIAAN